MLGSAQTAQYYSARSIIVNRGDLVGSEIPLALFQVGPSKMNDDQKRIVIVPGRTYCWNGFPHEFAALFIGH
jgi:hypothetical protein